MKWNQSYYRIVQRVPLSELLHLDNWEFKLYAYLLENADATDIGGTEDGEKWIWKPSNLNEVLGINARRLSRALSVLKIEGLIEVKTGMMMSRSEDGRILLYGSKTGKIETEIAAKIEGKESIVRDKLQAKIGGLPEFEVPTGRIDLLTEAEIIEVKHIRSWKSALGQVLAYGRYLPNHQQRLHLFGTEAELENVFLVKEICHSFGISVSTEFIEN